MNCQTQIELTHSSSYIRYIKDDHSGSISSKGIPTDLSTAV